MAMTQRANCEYIDKLAHRAKVAAALDRVLTEEAGVLERLKDA